MKRAFEEIDAECWESGGRLGTARPEICLLHSTQDGGRSILQALEELASEAPNAKRTLTFKASGRKRAISTLRLRLVPPRAELQVMSISRDRSTAAIEMTGTGLQILRDAVRTWFDGGEDFGVSPESSNMKKRELGALDRASGELWFWGPTMEP